MSKVDHAALRALAEAATPGPWEAEVCYGSPDILASGLAVAVTIASDMKTSVDKANAAYIAAAPDLFEALRALVAPSGGTTGYEADSRPAAAARAAIAKATGGAA